MSENSIQWLKFADILRERYGYLLNPELCLYIAEDAKEFAEMSPAHE